MARNNAPRGASYAPNPITQGTNAADTQEAFANTVNRQDQARAAENATQAAVKAAQASGAYLPPGAGYKGQSKANQANIARSVAAANAGGHMVMPRPMFGGQSPAASPTHPAFRGSTGPEVAAFDAGGAQPIPASGVTPYGTASVRAAAPGETLANGQASTPATVSDTGVSRAAPKDYTVKAGANGSVVPSMDAQQEIIAKYPSIADPNSPDHAAFLKSWQDQSKGLKAGDTYDKHLDLAGNVAGPGGDQPTPTAIPRGGAELAKTQTIPTPAGPSTATSVGQTIGALPGALSDTIADRVGGAITGAVGVAKDLYAGITGNSGANTGANSMNPPVVAGGTQSPKQIADASARAGLAGQTDSQYAGSGGSFATPTDETPRFTGVDNSDTHADIHAATVKAINQAGQNAHDAVNTPAAGPGVDTSYPGGTNSGGGSFSPDAPRYTGY